MKKLIIAITTVLLIGIVISCITFETQAVGLEALDNPDGYKQNVGDNSQIVNIGNIIVSIVRTLGAAVSVVMLMIVGIKYITGSVEEKAEYKQTMWPYIVGALLIFAGTTITSIIYEMFEA